MENKSDLPEDANRSESVENLIPGDALTDARDESDGKIDQPESTASDLSENPISLETDLLAVDIAEIDEHLQVDQHESDTNHFVPEPIRGNDIFTTVEIPFDIAQYGGRQFFTYPFGEGDKTSSWFVPDGTWDGREFRFHGQGNTGTFGGENGDLVVSVIVRPSERGKDIVHDINVSWEHAKYEHLATITTEISGELKPIKFSLPAGLQSGQYVRVRGAGLTDESNLPPGDLIIKVSVDDPVPPEDIHAYAVIGFWAGVKLFFRLSPEVKLYRIANNQFVKKFSKLKKRHAPEISWTFLGDGDKGEGGLPDSDLYLTPHYTSNAYRAPWVASLMMIAFLGLGVFGQQTLTWTGNDAFYAKFLSDPAQSGPSSSTRNEDITFETTTPNWAPSGFQLIESDQNVAVRMPDPSTYDCTAEKTLNCLNVEVYTRVKCEVMNASVTFYSADLSQSDTSKLVIKNVQDLKVITLKFFPHSKKPLPKWDYLTITCTKAK
jgi:hypothetical protein